MAKRTDVFNVSTIDTVISAGVRLKGNLASEGDIAIDGTLAGTITSGGHVAIGVNGQITGNIKATSIQVAGQVEGNLTALDSVSLIETAQVRGDIDTAHLEVGMGAVFIGQSKMKPVQAREVAPPEPAED